MAVQSLALFGLGLVFAISAHSVETQCADEECTSVAPDAAAGPSLLQARDVARRSRRGNSTGKPSVGKRGAHGNWGGCVDTNGKAMMNMDGEEWDCFGYEGDYVQYCDEDVDADGDFFPKKHCCACGGGGEKADPPGLDLESRRELCSGHKVGDRCRYWYNPGLKGIQTDLQSQCGADHDKHGHTVLACIPVYKLREFGVDRCKRAEDGTLCGQGGMSYNNSGNGQKKEWYKLCMCAGNRCETKCNNVDRKYLPELHDHEGDHGHDHDDSREHGHDDSREHEH